MPNELNCLQMKTIEFLIDQKQLTVSELARRSKISEERVEAISLGRWLASPDERAALAAVLEMEVDEINWGHFMNPRNVRYRQFGLTEDF